MTLTLIRVTHVKSEQIKAESYYMMYVKKMYYVRKNTFKMGGGSVK